MPPVSKLPFGHGLADTFVGDIEPKGRPLEALRPALEPASIEDISTDATHTQIQEHYSNPPLRRSRLRRELYRTTKTVQEKGCLHTRYIPSSLAGGLRRDHLLMIWMHPMPKPRTFVVKPPDSRIPHGHPKKPAHTSTTRVKGVRPVPAVRHWETTHARTTVYLTSTSTRPCWPGAPFPSSGRR